MANGDQWFAIFAADTRNLVSVGNAVAFPLKAGQRAITVDGDRNGRYWDASKLDWSVNPPQPPPPPPPVTPAADPMPYKEAWGKVDMVYKGQKSLAANITFHEPFDFPPLIDSMTVNVAGKASGAAYLRFTTGNITQNGFQLNAAADIPLNITVPVVWHAVQRWKDEP